MAVDLLSKEGRKKLIQDILGKENKSRRAESLRQVEIFNDRIYDHVYERLIKRFSETTVKEMPIISSINLARRISKQEASIYKTAPQRNFEGLSEEQEQVIELIYSDMSANSKMLKSNESYKLQNQNHVMIVPKNGKLVMRILRNHHLDSIDDPEDPESSIGYVISSMDKNELLDSRINTQSATGLSGKIDSAASIHSDGINQVIGDRDDFVRRSMRFLVWTKELNFIMDGTGDIISGDDIVNPLGFIPIVDISVEKDFEYWVRQGNSLSEFTVEYNTILSDLAQIVMMQGYSQSYLIAKNDLIPDAVKLGPNFLLKLPMEEGDSIRPEFGFATPSADIAGSIQYAEMVLANYLSSRGHESTLVSGQVTSSRFNSGIERLLSMIDKFEASKSDFDVYRNAEKQIYKIIAGWHNALIGTDKLERKYQTTNIPDTSELSIEFSGPEVIQTKQEKLDYWKNRIEAGLASRVDALMDIDGIEDVKEAKARVMEYDSEYSNEGLDADITEQRNEDS